MDRETAKQYVKGQLESYLQSRGINTRRPFRCLNPEHADEHPSMSIDKNSRSGPHCKCFSCGAYYDTFDLIGIDYGLTDETEIFKKAYEIFNITVDGYHRDTAQEDFAPAGGAYQKKAKNERITQPSIHNDTYTSQQAAEPEPDYTSFFLQANRDLERTGYHRGISLETLNRFKVGFVESWRHPKAPKMEPSPRLIIPTSKHSYLARHASEKDYINYRGEVENKSKVGTQRIFNYSALYTAQKPIIVVEGELDALSVIDVGGEAVGLGSANRHQALITMLEAKRPAQPLILALDNDKAGSMGMAELVKGLERLEIPFYRIDIAQPYKDANEALNADRAAFTAVIAQAEDIEAEREQLRREAVAFSLPDFLKNIEASKRAAFIPTGFAPLDSILDGGLYAGLYIVGAISSLGKTTFCLQIADQIAASGQDVLIFSLEMARNELIAKSVSRLTLVGDLAQNNSTANAKTTRGILTGTRYAEYNRTERELIQQSIAAYGAFAQNLYITEGVGNVGIEEIREKVRKHIKLTGKAPVVIIDYLQIIAPADVRATDKQNTDKAVLELKRMSRDYGIPIIGISSFNRDNYTAPVNLASFKESGAIEYSSDVLIGLQYDGMDYREGEADKAREKRIRELQKQMIADGKAGKAQKIQVKILKNRNGSKGDTLLSYYPMFNYFTAERAGAYGDDTDSGGNWKQSEGSYSRSTKTKRGKRGAEPEPDTAGAGFAELDDQEQTPFD